ncbi:transcriptional regulator [Candidatus Vondammii sp. HM_W22]|uniref:transcriptional regulator n=1 Tax=Candidatus Vondammii sp. HM_W22 TaxID=2687299 RepID=UPI001F14550F|nr:transcriptional regulator [Candidatus Vondammii sp. HM_W22]
MLIEGPMNITIGDPADGQGRVLAITFKPEFQALEIAEQGTEFRAYLQSLSDNISDIKDENDRARAGMLIVQQFAELLLPHIESRALALDESMVVQIRQESQVTALTDLLTSE